MSKSTIGCPVNVANAEYGCCQSKKTANFTSNGGIRPVEGYITWYLLDNKLSDTISKEDTIKGIEEAITYLEPHMGEVKFKQVETQREAQIVVGFYKNDDNTLPEQFGQSTLAYAFLGNGGQAFNIIGDMYFNDENFAWTLGATRTSIDFVRVWLHEALHSLGLHHQEFDSTGILFPSYNPNAPIKLTQDTINGLNSIYGGFEGPVEPEMPAEPPVVVEPPVVEPAPEIPVEPEPTPEEPEAPIVPEEPTPEEPDKCPSPQQCLLEATRLIFSRKRDLACLLESNLVNLATLLGLETDIKFKKSYTVGLIWQHLQDNKLT